MHFAAVSVLAPVEPSGSVVVATTQDSGCCCGDTEVIVGGVPLESYPRDISTHGNEEDGMSIPGNNEFNILLL